MTRGLKTVGSGIWIAVLVVGTIFLSGGGAAAEGYVLEADPKVQAAIRATMTASDEREYERSIEALRGILASDANHLIQQLLYFMHGAKGTREAMVFGTVVERLTISKEAIAKAMIPALGTDDPELRRKVQNILGGAEDRSDDRPPDFSMYRSVITAAKQRGEDPPEGMIQHMYESAPGAALLSLLRVYLVSGEDTKQILWAEHVVADVIWRQKNGFLKKDKADPAAADQLQRLAKRDEWWARLYVAEILRQHPVFRSQGLIDILRQDDHPLVRAPLGSVQDPTRSAREYSATAGGAP